MTRFIRTATFLAAITASAATLAHVTLPAGGATAGTAYDAAFRVGHACHGSTSTNGISVQLPEGFTFVSAQPRAGWTQTTSGRTIAWKADLPQNAVATSDKAEFIVRGTLTTQPGPLYFKVLQSCDAGSSDWAQMPAGTHEKPAFPAARLDVLAAGVAPVEVKDAWVRTAVKGQSGTGAFMKLQAPSGSRLVGVSTPEAGQAQVHEMKMDGDIMRMRPLASGLELPARQTVELKPGGYHVMLTDLKEALPVGSTVPVVLQFVDGEGRKSSAQLQLPVLAAPPAGAPSGGMADMPGMKH